MLRCCLSHALPVPVFDLLPGVSRVQFRQTEETYRLMLFTFLVGPLRPTHTTDSSITLWP